jgi:CheY-like chemotaxis protein
LPKGRTLLLADDSPTVQKVVSLTFDDEGFTVIAVGGGSQALEELGRAIPDVVLADVHMPAPGGYELCARIKRDARTRHVPVMLLVGAFEPFDEAEARRVGADEVLTKPFQSIRDLVNKVGGMLGAQPDPVEPGQRDARDAAREGDAASRPRASDSPADERAGGAARARQVEARGGESGVTSAPEFADFGIDDEGIETVTPDEFAARSHPRAAEFAEPRPKASAAPQGFAAAASAAPPRAQTFESRADAAAAADDALLELGDFDSSSARDTASDDFVLDIGDADAPAATRAAAAEPAAGAPSYDAEAYADDTPSAVETMGAGSLSMAEPSVAWDAAEKFAVPHEAITEPAQGSTHEEVDTAVAHFDGAVGQAVEARDARSLGEPATAGSAAASESGSEELRAPVQSGASELSPEAVDAIARRVVAHLSERVVREIAWEVVPDLAERLIRRKLEEEETRAK